MKNGINIWSCFINTTVDNIPSFIIYKDEHPIGFIQYYWLTEHYPEGIQDANHLLFKQYHPNELVGIDLFLADQNNRGRGLRVLTTFLRKCNISKITTTHKGYRASFG